MSAVPQPSTEQLVVAMVGALAPLAGPYGLPVAAVVTAVDQLVTNFRAAATNDVVSMSDLLALQLKVAADWNQLAADVAAQTNKSTP